jgi:Ser/Thr protein kinase RdoA (MazF antagonist)
MDSNLRFNGSEDELLKIFNLYELNVLSTQIFKDGIINTSYCLEISSGEKVVLRVYQNTEKSNENIEKELDFMNEMKNFGVPVPAVLNNNKGKKLTIFKDSHGKEWRCIVMTFVEGRHLKPNDFGFIPEFATYQAKMHLASIKINKNPDGPNFKAMIDWMDKEFEGIKSKKLTKDIFGSIEKIYIELKKDIEVNYKNILDLSYGDVHLDYDSENIIVKDGKIKAILDFDDISLQPFILDTANSLWWWLFKNKKEDYKKILQKYFESYEKIRNISEKEHKQLSLFLRMRNLTLICLLYVNIGAEINYIRINEGLAIDPLLKNIKNFMDTFFI